MQQYNFAACRGAASTHCAECHVFVHPERKKAACLTCDEGYILKDENQWLPCLGEFAYMFCFIIYSFMAPKKLNAHLYNIEKLNYVQMTKNN